MLACIDVDYRTDHAKAACVLFEKWADAQPFALIVKRINHVEPYVPGEFYRRELPCILAVLERNPSSLDVVVIDGYVWLDSNGRPGLGAHLHRALGEKIPIIGVAKKPFAGAAPELVLRGFSTNPLYITAAGMDSKIAAERIRSMDGPSRIPTLLKRVDALCRSK